MHASSALVLASAARIAIESIRGTQVAPLDRDSAMHPSSTGHCASVDPRHVNTAEFLVECADPVEVQPGSAAGERWWRVPIARFVGPAYLDREWRAVAGEIARRLGDAEASEVVVHMGFVPLCSDRQPVRVDVRTGPEPGACAACRVAFALVE